MSRAHNQGYKAHVPNEEPHDTNPFPEGSWNANDYIAGWNEAQKEYESKQELLNEWFNTSTSCPWYADEFCMATGFKCEQETCAIQYFRGL